MAKAVLLGFRHQAQAEGLDLFAQAPILASRGTTPCRISTRPSTVTKEYSDRPQWNPSTVPKPWSLEGFKSKHTPSAAWALTEDRRSLETKARELRLHVMTSELARYVRHVPLVFRGAAV
eukprot:symbB.v1.2.016687.t1/scaffold1265.1/size127786/2